MQALTWPDIEGVVPACILRERRKVNRDKLIQTKQGWRAYGLFGSFNPSWL
jgi:hypothetical protein